MTSTAAGPSSSSAPVGARPLRIGVSACFFHADPERPVFKGKTLLYAEESMLDLVGRTGALALMVPRPTPTGPGVGDYVDLLDGLLLEGGSDVCPRTYGEEPLRPSWEGDEARDRYEIELIHAFHDAAKPVLGICRGVQILNVAFGGTLYQDIATQVPGAADHRNWDVYDANRHEVDLTTGSRLAQLYGGAGRATVNSVHHQAVRDVADGFDVEATSVTDGIVEALRRPGPTFLAGVQWHPEFTPLDDPDQVPAAPVIDDFLAAAARATGLARPAGVTA
jgi:putative glutamine amidotransferase